MQDKIHTISFAKYYYTLGYCRYANQVQVALHDPAALSSLGSVWVPWDHCQQGQTFKASIPMLEMFMLLLFFLSG